MKYFFSPEKKKVIFFDLNDTLLNQRGAFDNCFMERLEEFTARWDSDSSDWNVKTALQRFHAERQKRSEVRSKRSLSKEQIHLLCLKNALQNSPLNWGEAQMKSFFRQLKQCQPNYTQLFPEVPETLEYLSRHYRLAIISNTPKKSEDLPLERLGLSSFFNQDHVFTSKKTGCKKPESGIFQFALNTMNITPSQGVMVGNSWRHDIFGATRCGLDAVWIFPANKKKYSQRKVGKERIMVIRSIAHLKHIFGTHS